MEVRRLPYCIALVALVLFTVSLTRSLHVNAQGEEGFWTQPINLSRSGAASDPRMLGTGQVFWVDQFDGLMTARRGEAAWGDPSLIPLRDTGTLSQNAAPLPLLKMPDLHSDTQGTLHAFWQGAEPVSDVPVEDTEAAEVAPEGVGVAAVEPSALLYSRRPADGAGWSAPRMLSSSVRGWDLVEDAAGTLHLLYIRGSRSGTLLPGVYYQRSTDKGSSWTSEILVYENIYFRLLSEPDARVQLVVDDAGLLHAVWDDPRGPRSFYSRSGDGGSTWAELSTIEAGDAPVKNIRLSAGYDGQLLRVWESAGSTNSCVLYQQQSTDAGVTWTELSPAVELSSICPTWRLWRPAPDSLLWVAGEGSASISLAAWNGSEWSTPKRLDLHLQDPQNGQWLSLTSLSVGGGGDTITVVGQGQDGEIWVADGQFGLLEWVFAPPSPWTDPVNLAPVSVAPVVPALAVDREGEVHALWTDATAVDQPRTALYYARTNGATWAPPLEVSQASGSSEEQASVGEVALVAVADRLHVVWSSEPHGKILHTWTRIGQVPSADGWAPPVPLPVPDNVACCPSIATDAQGMLHVVYAVPFNEGRGLYHTYSSDGGATWSEPQQILDGVAAGRKITHPRLTIDGAGVMHLVGVHAPLLDNKGDVDIFYMRSTNGGKSWLVPLALAEGQYEAPLLAVSDDKQVHVLWREATGAKEWEQRRSTDGSGWTPAELIPGFTGVTAPAGLVPDGAGALYLVGILQQTAGRSELRLSTWNGAHWTPVEAQALYNAGGPGTAAALQPALGQLALLFPVQAAEGDVVVQHIGAISRAVPTVIVTPAPTFTPQPTVTPVPTVAPSPTLTPVPELPPFGSASEFERPTNDVGRIATVGGLLLTTLLAGAVSVIRSRRK